MAQRLGVGVPLGGEVLEHHVELRPGDVVHGGRSQRLAVRPGGQRHLVPGASAEVPQGRSGVQPDIVGRRSRQGSGRDARVRRRGHRPVLVAVDAQPVRCVDTDPHLSVRGREQFAGGSARHRVERGCGGARRLRPRDGHDDECQRQNRDAQMIGSHDSPRNDECLGILACAASAGKHRKGCRAVPCAIVLSVDEPDDRACRDQRLDTLDRLIRLSAVVQSGLGRREPGDRHPER